MQKKHLIGSLACIQGLEKCLCKGVIWNYYPITITEKLVFWDSCRKI